MNTTIISKVFTRIANTNGYMLCPRFFRAAEKTFRNLGALFRCAAATNTSCIAYVANEKYYIYYNYKTKRYITEKA